MPLLFDQIVNYLRLVAGRKMSVRWFLLHAVCMFYAFSFASFYFDYPSLVGPNGILPVSETIDAGQKAGNGTTVRGLVAEHWNIIWLHRMFGVPMEQFAELIALAGFFGAVLGFVSKSSCNVVTMSLLWLGYKSLCDCGSVFYEHIYDRLLLEAGALCVFWAPWSRLQAAFAQHPTDRLVHWFFRWLLVRLTVSITVSRLLLDSQSLINSYWWNLVRSSQFYLQAVPNPSQLTYAFATVNREMPAYSNLFYGSIGISSELAAFVGPLTYFIPIRGFRIAAFLMQFLLQIYAILAFNFGPFHLLVLVLHCALFKDQVSGAASVKRQRYRKLKLAFGMFLWFALWTLASIFLYEMHVTRADFMIVRKLNQAELATYLSKFLLAVIVVATVSFFVTVLRANYDAFRYSSAKSSKRSFLRSKPVVIVTTLVYSIIAVYVFYLTQLTVQKLHSDVEPIRGEEARFLSELANRRLVNEYRDPVRLTDKMMEFGRPEIVLEVAWDWESGPWIELEMDAKVGKLNRIGRFNVPYLPRLQYQLWKLAQESFTNGTFSLSLASFKQNRWLASYLYRILDPKTSAVFVAYREQHEPQQPLFVRASFYSYQFNTKTAGHYWKRTKKSSNYFEAMHLNGTKHNNDLLGLMSATKLKYPFKVAATAKSRDSLKKKQGKEASNIFVYYQQQLPILCEEMLGKIREVSDYLHPEVFIRASFFTLVAFKIFFV